MPRAKKDCRNLNIKLATETHDLLDKFCDETGISKTAATEKILNKFFDEYFKKPKEERSLFS